MKNLLAKDDWTYKSFNVFIIISLTAPLLFFSAKYSIYFFSFAALLLILSCLVNVKSFYKRYYNLNTLMFITPFILIWLYILISFLLKNKNDWGYIAQVTTGLFLTSAIAIFVDSSKRLKKLTSFLFIFLIINIIIGLLQTVLPFNVIKLSSGEQMFGDLIRSSYTPKGLFQSQNPYSMFILSLSTVFLFTENIKRFIALVITLIIIIVTTQSYGALILLTFTSFFLVLTGTLNRKHSKLLFTKGVLLLFLVIALPNILLFTHKTLSYPVKISKSVTFRGVASAIFKYKSNIKDELASLSMDNADNSIKRADSLSLRKKFIGSSLRYWLQEKNSILYGIGAGKSIYINHEELSKAKRRTYNYAHIHNSFVEILVEFGIVGFFLILFSFALLLYKNVIQLIKINSHQNFNLHTGILYSFLSYLVFGGFVLHSIIWNYRDLYLLLGLFLCSTLILLRGSTTNEKN